MTESAQIPAAQNPSKADTSYWDCQPAWLTFNHILFIVTSLPTSSYEQAIQVQIQNIQGICQNMVGRYEGVLPKPDPGQLSPSDAAKLIAPLAAQLQASASPYVAEFGDNLVHCNNDMASLSTSSENIQIPAAQNAAENPGQPDYSDPSWQSDFDALNGIQYVLYLMSVIPNLRTWSDAIQSDLDTMYNFCQIIAGMTPLSGPITALNSSDAAKLIASIADPLIVNSEPPSHPQSTIYSNLTWIVDACKNIDPSSAS